VVSEKLKERGYITVRTIGSGSFGVVDLIRRSKDGKLFTAKCIRDFKTKKEEDIIHEAKVMRRYRHANIVSFLESFRAKSVFVIVMEYCDSGDLQERLKFLRTEGRYLSKQKALRWFVQIAFALEYLHNCNVLHRDVKPGNIFLSHGGDIAKLGDLGNTRILENTRDMASTSCGTPFYMSPELGSSNSLFLPHTHTYTHTHLHTHTHTARGQTYNKKSDIWSLGCVLYEMISLRKPFPAKGLAELVLKIASQDPVDNLPFEVCRPGGKLSQMIKSMLHKNSTMRPCIEDILNLQPSRDVIEELAKSKKQSLKAVSELCLEHLKEKDVHEKEEEKKKKKREEEDYEVISATPLKPFAPSPALTVTKKVAKRIYEELFVELQRHLKEKKMIAQDARRRLVGRVFVVKDTKKKKKKERTLDKLFGKLIVPWLRVKWSDWQANTNDFVGTIEDQTVVRAMWVRKDSSVTTFYVLLFSSTPSSSSSSWNPLNTMLKHTRGLLKGNQQEDLKCEELAVYFPAATTAPLLVPIELIENALSTSIHLAGQDVSLNLLRPPPHSPPGNTTSRKKRRGRDRSSSSSSVASNSSRDSSSKKSDRRSRRSRSRSSRRRSKSRDSSSKDNRRKKKGELLKDTALPPLFLSPIVTEDRKSTKKSRRHSATSAPSPTYKAFRRRKPLPKIVRPWSAPHPQNDGLTLTSSSPSPQSIQSEPLPSPPIITKKYARGSPHMWILDRKRRRSISSETFDKTRTSSHDSDSVCSSFDECVAMGFESKSSSPVEALATSLSQILSDDNLLSPGSPSLLPQPALIRTKSSGGSSISSSSSNSRRASLPPMVPRNQKRVYS